MLALSSAVCRGHSDVSLEAAAFFYRQRQQQLVVTSCFRVATSCVAEPSLERLSGWGMAAPARAEVYRTWRAIPNSEANCPRRRRFLSYSCAENPHDENYNTTTLLQPQHLVDVGYTFRVILYFLGCLGKFPSLT